MGSIKVALPRFPESECTFTLTSLLSFIIFEILFHLVATTKNLFFLCGKVLKLVHLSVVSKFYDSPIPLNEADHTFPPNILVSYLIFVN